MGESSIRGVRNITTSIILETRRLAIGINES
jgi:hypothetical protein